MAQWGSASTAECRVSALLGNCGFDKQLFFNSFYSQDVLKTKSLSLRSPQYVICWSWVFSSYYLSTIFSILYLILLEVKMNRNILSLFDVGIICSIHIIFPISLTKTKSTKSITQKYGNCIHIGIKLSNRRRGHWRALMANFLNALFIAQSRAVSPLGCEN